MNHFVTLFKNEARQSLGYIYVGLASLVAIGLLAFFFIPDKDFVRGTLVFTAFAIPIVQAIFRGFAQIRLEYLRNTHYLLHSLPTQGITIILSKYAWLVLEVLLFTLVAVFCLVGLFPESSNVLDPSWKGYLKTIAYTYAKAIPLLLPLPATAYVAILLGRLLPKWDLLIAFISYFTITSLYIKFISLLHINTTIYQDYSTTWEHGDTQYVLWQVVWTGILLLVSGVLFDQQDI